MVRRNPAGGMGRGDNVGRLAGQSLGTSWAPSIHGTFPLRPLLLHRDTSPSPLTLLIRLQFSRLTVHSKSHEVHGHLGRQLMSSTSSRATGRSLPATMAPQPTKVNSGWVEVGLPLQVGVGYTSRDHCDGQGLASPGRWPHCKQTVPTFSPLEESCGEVPTVLRGTLPSEKEVEAGVPDEPQSTFGGRGSRGRDSLATELRDVAAPGKGSVRCFRGQTRRGQARAKYPHLAIASLCANIGRTDPTAKSQRESITMAPTAWQSTRRQDSGTKSACRFPRTSNGPCVRRLLKVCAHLLSQRM